MPRPDTEHNLLTVLLGGALAAVVLAGLLSPVLLGRSNVDAIEPAPARDVLAGARTLELPELPELSEFSAITRRPVFFADRSLPIIESPGDGDDEQLAEVEPEPELEVPPLEAEVAGIIITPEQRLAMVTDNASGETRILSEGMTLAGDKSAWRVTGIRARGVDFESATGDVEQLELEVETDALKAGARVVQRNDDSGQRASPGADTTDPDDAEAQARARAEEIRRRVAERRAQLRAEAERRARQQADDDGRP